MYINKTRKEGISTIMRTYKLTGDFCTSEFSFIVPFYQRGYSWTKSECETLLNNILERLENKEFPHFMGTLCLQNCIKEKNLYMVVDGQQRLTSLMLFLLAIRDLSNNLQFREIITNEYLLNYDMPRIKLKAKDAVVFEKLIFQEDDIFATSNITKEEEQTLLYQNYNFFYNKIYEFLLKHHQYTTNHLINAFGYLEFVVIELEDENPQVVFQSLNATGKSLTELDKIKNYTLVPMNPSKQEEVYEKYWIKLEEIVGDDLEEFILSYLVIQNKSDFVEAIQEKMSTQNLYEAFKALNCEKCTISTLENLCNFAKYYEQLKIRTGSAHVIFNVLKVNAAMTFCLYLLRKEDEFQENLEEAFELYLSYIIRGKVCERSNIKNAHSGYLITITENANDKKSFIFLLSSAFIQSSGPYKFPNNKEFRNALVTNDIYLSLGPAGTKYLLYEIEKAEIFRQRELPSIEEGTIEHIMPQTLTQEWEKMLKNDRYCYAQKLHTLGNLTITLFNSELSNKPFEDKRKIYKTEPYYYTKDVARNDKWGSLNINRRAEDLAGIALNIWKGLNIENFGYEKAMYTVYSEIDIFVGKKPHIVSVLNEERTVKSWNNMCYFVYSTLNELDEITMLRFLYSEKNDLLGDAPMGTGSRKVAEGLYLAMNGGVKKILTNIRQLVEFYDKNSEIMVSDKLWFTIK